MRHRGPLLITGALGLVVLAVGVVAIVTSVNHAESIRATMLARTIKINSVVTLAAAPSDAGTRADCPVGPAADQAPGYPRQPHPQIPASRVKVQVKTSGRVLEPRTLKRVPRTA
jgi:hypothetical protein